MFYLEVVSPDIIDHREMLSPATFTQDVSHDVADSSLAKFPALATDASGPSSTGMVQSQALTPGGKKALKMDVVCRWWVGWGVDVVPRKFAW